MVSYKFLIVIAIAMFGYALSTKAGCDAKTINAFLNNYSTPTKKEDFILKQIVIKDDALQPLK
jgi:hypothetical protein